MSSFAKNSDADAHSQPKPPTAAKNERQNVFSCFHENLLQHLFNQPSNHFFPLLNKPFRDRKKSSEISKNKRYAVQPKSTSQVPLRRRKQHLPFFLPSPHSSLVPANHQLMQTFKAIKKTPLNGRSFLHKENRRKKSFYFFPPLSFLYNIRRFMSPRT